MDEEMTIPRFIVSVPAYLDYSQTEAYIKKKIQKTYPKNDYYSFLFERIY